MTQLKASAQWDGSKWDSVGSGIIAKKGTNVRTYRSL